ncbi:MAG: ubiquinone biosynthesis protein UbiB, partial [Candidatus Nomurabacteria bacterium GW2011_GWA2_40_9]
MVFSFKKEVRDLNRFRQILLVLFEEGFGYLLDRTRLKREIPLKSRIKQKQAKKKTPPEVRLRLTLERLGPTFIKLGQLLSIRPDLLPKEYIKELGKLQDKVKEFPFELVEKEIKKEFGKDISGIFSSFDKKPIASASISQVHKARLKTGEIVAVKIQRPKVREIMETDIDIMFHIARTIEKYMPELRKYGLVRIVEEFSKWTNDELNFKIEARNAKRFRKNFSGSRIVRIPKIYDDYTRERIIVMEFIDGIELHNVEEIKRKKLDFDKIIKNGFDVILTSVFVHGFFHADPHPGNILVMKN